MTHTWSEFDGSRQPGSIGMASIRTKRARSSKTVLIILAIFSSSSSLRPVPSRHIVAAARSKVSSCCQAKTVSTAWRGLLQSRGGAACAVRENDTERRMTRAIQPSVPRLRSQPRIACLWGSANNERTYRASSFTGVPPSKSRRSSKADLRRRSRAEPDPPSWRLILRTILATPWSPNLVSTRCSCPAVLVTRGVYARGESKVEERREGAVAGLTRLAPPANCQSHDFTKVFDAAIPLARFNPDVHALVLRRAGSRDRRRTATTFLTPTRDNARGTGASGSA
jgi:hypothetical protein